MATCFLASCCRAGRVSCSRAFLFASRDPGASSPNACFSASWSKAVREEATSFVAFEPKSPITFPHATAFLHSAIWASASRARFPNTDSQRAAAFPSDLVAGCRLFMRALARANEAGSWVLRSLADPTATLSKRLRNALAAVLYSSPLSGAGSAATSTSSSDHSSPASCPSGNSRSRSSHSASTSAAKVFLAAVTSKSSSQSCTAKIKSTVEVIPLDARLLIRDRTHFRTSLFALTLRPISELQIFITTASEIPPATPKPTGPAHSSRAKEFEVARLT
mmetsp:Transcript_11304/g.16675  ORF Transcript_11304/g.16675 Transcript_11304/m.16675 type:complete len:278 (+) Transcript_11304:652-1485(+)